jgi:hypothetical protein
VAVSFFLLAPYIAAEGIGGLIHGDRPETSITGLMLTAGTAILEPGLGIGGSEPGSARRPPLRKAPRTCCAATSP